MSKKTNGIFHLKKEVTKYQGQVQERDETIEKVNRENEELIKEKEKLERENTKLTQENTKLEERLAGQQHTVVEKKTYFETALSFLNNYLNQISKEVTSKAEKIKENHGDYLQPFEKRSASLLNEVKSNKELINDYETVVSKKTRILLQPHYEQAKKAVEELEQQLQDEEHIYSKRHEEAVARLNNLKREYEDRFKELKQLGGFIGSTVKIDLQQLIMGEYAEINLEQVKEEIEKPRPEQKLDYRELIRQAISENRVNGDVILEFVQEQDPTFHRKKMNRYIAKMPEVESHGKTRGVTYSLKKQ